MGMTIIEQDTMHSIQGACRQIMSSGKIDWEQRRYEIAKDIFVGMIHGEFGYSFSTEYAKDAVKYANALIEELKKK